VVGRGADEFAEEAEAGFADALDHAVEVDLAEDGDAGFADALDHAVEVDLAEDGDEAARVLQLDVVEGGNRARELRK